MQKRIRDLYIARDIPYEGPIFITLLPSETKLKPGDEILLFKTPENDMGGYEIIGIKREDFIDLSPRAEVNDISIHVANTADTVAKGTKPAFRIYDRIHSGAYARIMFILQGFVIAVVEDWGLEANN